MNFMSNSNLFQVQNQGQIAQAQSNKNEYRRVTQPYKRKSDSDVEAISDDKKRLSRFLARHVQSISLILLVRVTN